MDAAMIVLVWRRVKRVESLFLALAERVRSGRYRGGWIRVARAKGDAAVSAGVAGTRRASGCAGMPRRIGWLIRLMPYEAAAYGSQLSYVLAEPEIVALLRDVPQAGRIVRPLLAMLGLVGMTEPGVVTVAEATARSGIRVRKKRVVWEFGRIPLPRGVLAAARRQGFGRVG